MALNFYESKLEMLPKNPHDSYVEHMQALINERWDNTTTLLTIKRENPFGSLKFDDIEAHVIHAIDKSTGMKQGDDFRELIFRDLDVTVELGTCWYFDDNYWLAINLDEYNRTSKNIFVRRCNNSLRWYDPEDGHLIEIPCILGYDTTSPSPQVDNDVVTPNNKIEIICQGNPITSAIKVNQRFMFRGRPFKVTGYNNYMWLDEKRKDSSIIYMDAYLDEISPYDDLLNNIAYNKETNYKIQIDQGNITQLTEYTTQLTTTIWQDGVIVTKPVTWSSSDKDIVSVDNTGTIVLKGQGGSSAQITAQLGENTDVKATIDVNIESVIENNYQIKVSPQFTQVKQNQTIQFTASLYNNNVKQDNAITITGSGAEIDSYELRELGNNTFSIIGKKVSKLPLILNLTTDVYSVTYTVKLVAMF